MAGGGGLNAAQAALVKTAPFGLIAALLALRLVIGAVSYAASTPGGVFAPMILLGALIGVLHGLTLQSLLPGLEIDRGAMAVLGMAALFTAVIRAPVTGIVLATEMTHGGALLLPMLIACFAAMTVPEALRVPPLDDALRERLASTRGRDS